ncbi:MAG: hypothetical protein ABMB14_32740, partial [Myxococcota bacterium]
MSDDAKDPARDPAGDPDPSLRRRAAKRLLGTASNLVTRARIQAQALAEGGEARPAVVADVLLMESQHAAYVQIHRRFTERADRGEGGLGSALEALDAMWQNIRQLRGGAGAILLTLSNPDDAVQGRRARFYAESTRLLEDAIRAVFATDLGQLAIPPERMAVLVRVVLEGLVVELAQARIAADVSAVDQAYLDLRLLFERFVLPDGAPPEAAPLVLEPIPLPVIDLTEEEIEAQCASLGARTG